MNTKTEKTEIFWHKNRNTDLKNNQNRKSQYPLPQGMFFFSKFNFSAVLCPMLQAFFKRSYPSWCFWISASSSLHSFSGCLLSHVISGKGWLRLVAISFKCTIQILLQCAVYFEINSDKFKLTPYLSRQNMFATKYSLLRVYLISVFVTNVWVRKQLIGTFHRAFTVTL